MASGKRSKANRRNNPKVGNSAKHPMGALRANDPNQLDWTNPLVKPMNEILEQACTLESMWFGSSWGQDPLILAIDASGKTRVVVFGGTGAWAAYRQNPLVPAGTVAILLMAEMMLPAGAMPSLSADTRMPSASEARMISWLDINGRNCHVKRFRGSEKRFAMVGDGGPGIELASRALNVYPVIDERRLAMDFVKAVTFLAAVDASHRNDVRTMVEPLLHASNPVASLKASLLAHIGVASSGDPDLWKKVSVFRKNIPPYSVEELEIELRALYSNPDVIASKFRQTFGLAA